MKPRPIMPHLEAVEKYLRQHRAEMKRGAKLPKR